MGIINVSAADLAAMDDSFDVDEDSILSDDVTINDLAAQGIGSVNLVDDVTNGILTLSTDGSFVYQPNLDFDGTDRFS